MAYSINPHDAYLNAKKTLDPKEQIIMLYDAAICYVQQAKQAIEEDDQSLRFERINQTISIINGLRACLDFGANEEVAKALDTHYEAVDGLLVSIQCDNNVEVCDQVIENLKIIKQTWEEINIPPSSDEDAINLPPNIEKNQQNPDANI